MCHHPLQQAHAAMDAEKPRSSAAVMEVEKPSMSSAGVSRPGQPGDADEAHYLHTSGASLYGQLRSRNDSCWTISYCVLSAVVFFWGIAAFTNT